MKKITWQYFFICVIINISNIELINAQCEWIYQDRDPNSYILDGDQLTLFYCENTTGEFTPPPEYQDGWWQYNTESGSDCQNWGQFDNLFTFSIDYNDPCMGDLSNNIITVTFYGISNDPNNPDVCEFDVLFNDPGGPHITVTEGDISYETNEQIVVCENNNIILTASGMGSYPDYSSIQWYINGELIEGENTIDLILSSTNYDINQANTFYFESSNYCSNGSYVESEWLTITIYEGYNDCDPCTWEFPNYDNNEFYGFCIDCDGDGYFPEKPNNEQNRNFENPNKIPTCEATIYRLSIYNRLGRQIFESEYDNHPWNGKLSNGRKCKEGTYYYKIEYILNPELPEDTQNETKFSTGTVFLTWGN